MGWTNGIVQAAMNFSKPVIRGIVTAGEQTLLRMDANFSPRATSYIQSRSNNMVGALLDRPLAQMAETELAGLTPMARRALSAATELGAGKGMTNQQQLRRLSHLYEGASEGAVKGKNTLGDLMTGRSYDDPEFAQFIRGEGIGKTLAEASNEGTVLSRLGNYSYQNNWTGPWTGKDASTYKAGARNLGIGVGAYSVVETAMDAMGLSILD